MPEANLYQHTNLLFAVCRVMRCLPGGAILPAPVIATHLPATSKRLLICKLLAMFVDLFDGVLA
jgi:hypothetical protein